MSERAGVTGSSDIVRLGDEGVHMAGVDLNRASVGIRVALPFEQDVNPFVTQMFEHRSLFPGTTNTTTRPGRHSISSSQVTDTSPDFQQLPPSSSQMTQSHQS